MTIRHMDFEDNFKTIYIGIVYDHCANETNDEKYGVENINMDKYKKGLDKLMDAFEEYVPEL